ncbi:MAG: MgtC/SapB family protein [Candidatus Latescibacteria bacterium]|nr:MgtC/SapB family protein [Candidatus Latescibacterota bacterium]
MDNLSMVGQILLAALLGGIVGLEREWRHRPAGLRVQMLVALGACLFTLASRHGFPGSDPARVAAQIITGIGFIGAGTMLRTESTVRGMTTAATVWVVAAIGMAVGVRFYRLAVVTTVLVALILVVLRKLEHGIEELTSNNLQ